MLIETTMKNGYSFVTDCDELTTAKNDFTGALVEVNWIGCKTGKPIYIDVSDVVSIVRLDNVSKPTELRTTDKMSEEAKHE